MTTAGAEKAVDDGRLQKEFSAWIEGSGISQTKAAAMLGVASGTLSAVLSGTYSGNTERILSKIVSFMARQRDREVNRRHRQRDAFVMTSVARRVFSIAQLAHDEGEICVCIGDAGVGKTMAATAYRDTNPGVLMVRVDGTFSQRVLLSEIHKELGGSDTGEMRALFKTIIERLRDSERLIIVDEAERLAAPALELLRDIHDNTGAGILMVGLRRLHENIRGRHGQFAQMYSRVGGVEVLDTITEADVDLLVEQHIKEANGVAKVIYEEGKHNPRTCSKIRKRAISAAAHKGGIVTDEIVRQVARKLPV